MSPMTSMKRAIAALLFFASLTSSITSVAAEISDTDQLKSQASAIQKLHVQHLLSERKPEGYWLYPPYMGIAFVSQYWLVAHWLGYTVPSFDVQKFEELVFSEQLSDGSWYFLPDEGIHSDGHVGVTVLNYWALKSMGVPIYDPRMLLAKKFILKNGGMEKSNNFVKLLLMAFGNLDWSSFPTPPSAPIISVKDSINLLSPQFGLWMRPYIPSIAYLANLRVQKKLGPNFSVEELAQSYSSIPLQDSKSYEFSKEYSGAREPDLALSIFNDQRLGYHSWGGMTPATLFSMMAMDHAQQYMPEKRAAMKEAIKKGLSFVDMLSVKADGSSYHGAIFDGRYWDTVLIGGTLIEAGVPRDQVALSANYIQRRINERTGGMAFGVDFEPDMDTDDTSEMLIFFRRGGFFSKSVGHAVAWLSQMQNDVGPGSGGWGSFNKNNNPSFPVTFITEKFRDSTEIFDPTTPDVTGHILEALGLSGFKLSQSVESESSTNESPMLTNAVNYMRRSQRPNGTWFGRWGVNSIYGTSFSIVGLREVGVPASDPMIQKGISWINHCQKINGDGGFGESFLSYSNSELDCLSAPSSPTQTAWALLALLKVYEPTNPRIFKAIEYLVKSYDSTRGWEDKVINGTGHPVVAPMFYPSYAKIFPLQAISRWLTAINNAMTNSGKAL